MSSFAKTIKNDLCDIYIKNMCCKRAQLYGILLFSNRFDATGISLITESEVLTSHTEMLLLECYGGVCDIEYYGQGYKLSVTDPETLRNIFLSVGLDLINKRLLECKNCQNHFFRGVFLSCGTINSPESSYHLEMSSPNRKLLEELSDMLSKTYITPKVTKRNQGYILYLKDSENIEDFLNLIGARKAAFTIMNEKIRREIRNNANRMKNCDTANIKKSISASFIYYEAIKKLIDSNIISTLPDELQQTAKLRYENPDISLSELARLHEPQLTKSGLNHRLKRILEFSNKI